jgi:hypothetical protein
MYKMKKLINEMKEEIKSLAVIQRANKESHRENQRNQGYVQFLLNQDGTQKKNSEWNYNGDFSPYVTVLHIIYNRIRNRKPHLGSVEKEEEYLNGKDERWMVPRIYEELSTKYQAEETEVVAWLASM